MKRKLVYLLTLASLITVFNACGTPQYGCPYGALAPSTDYQTVTTAKPNLVNATCTTD